VFDRRHRLVQLRFLDNQGTARVTRLSDHRSVDGVLVPHRVTSVKRGKEQTVEYSRVEINPKIESK
jgi:hypothetical protein